MQRIRYRVITVAAAFLMAALPATAQRQVSNTTAADGAVLEPSTRSAEALAAYRAALFEAFNASPAIAREHVAVALRADPEFGLAHALNDMLTVGLAPAERARRVGEALSRMGSATAPELLLALYWREAAAGRPAVALPLAQALVQLVPGDADVAWIYTTALNAGRSPAEQAENIRRLLGSHPRYGAAQNQLVYALLRSNDAAGALAAAQELERIAPDHWNTHDTHSDVLLLMDRPDEALAHITRAGELAPQLPWHHSRAGVVHLMKGDVRAARAAFAAGLAAASAPGMRFEILTWNAVAHVYAHDAKAAVAELARIATEAESQNLSAAAGAAHRRAAVVEAYLGDRRAVAAHLDAAMRATPDAPANQLMAAVAYSRMGQRDQAGAAAATFKARNGDANAAANLDALLALDAGDLGAAEAALQRTAPQDRLALALRAELRERQGRESEAEMLRRDVLSSSVKLDSGQGVDFMLLVGRMRVDRT